MDPERILGSLVKSALFGRRLPTSSKVALGLGALGVAIAAIEHVQEKKGTPTPPPPPPILPPPPPGAPPPGVSASAEALLLVRAMIAAAHADGTFDPEERRIILERLAREPLTDDEREILTRELNAPLSGEALAAMVTSRQLAEEVYAASVLAIRVDSPAEREYLARLAALLGLDGETRARLHRLLGAPLPA